MAASAWTFRDPGQLSGQADGLFFPMLEGQMRFDYSWNNEHDRLTLQPYGRWDIRTDRDLIDLNSYIRVCRLAHTRSKSDLITFEVE